MDIEFNLDNEVVISKMKKTQFIDIETSLVNARVFRTGQQFINIDQISSQTRILTVAGGSMYDLLTVGIDAVWAYGNHMYESFDVDPLDDRAVLQEVWDILDSADVIVAHNASFDKGWLQGRFLQLGWSLPSPYKLVCTYKGLTGFNMNSKKLDSLSELLIGTNKIKTNFSLWDRCSSGDEEAFEEMMEYNIGDIYDTLYQVYIRTCAYYPKSCIDLSIPGIPSCKVTGAELADAGEWINPNNGNIYNTYVNEDLNIYYRDRNKTSSSKAGRGFIIPIK